MGLTKSAALQHTAERLAELFEVRPQDVLIEAETDAATGVRIRVAGFHFQVEWRASGKVDVVARGVRALQHADSSPTLVPLLVVPYMGAAGQRRCRDAGVAWLDLSGNAHIVVPGLRIVVLGHDNEFKKVGRPSNAFAPKSARISRWLLMHPNEPTLQRDLARHTGVDEGYTSRIVGRLTEMDLLRRDADGLLSVPEPGLLLDAWSEGYRFDRHRLVRGHLAARTGDELTDKLASRLRANGIAHAFTGLPAAWQYSHFAMFRLASVYLPDGATQSTLEALGVREGSRGANVWLLTPDDEGVLQGASDVDGLRCVHPVQVWLDLQEHPERASEAADALRSQYLSLGGRSRRA